MSVFEQFNDYLLGDSHTIGSTNIMMLDFQMMIDECTLSGITEHSMQITEFQTDLVSHASLKVRKSLFYFFPYFYLFFCVFQDAQVHGRGPHRLQCGHQIPEAGRASHNHPLRQLDQGAESCHHQVSQQYDIHIFKKKSDFN